MYTAGTGVINGLVRCASEKGRTKRCTGVAAGGFSVFRASAGRNPVNAVVMLNKKQQWDGIVDDDQT